MLKVKAVYVTGRPGGEADDFLITADKNPNRKGLTDVAAALGITLKPFSELTQALDANQVKALFALRRRRSRRCEKRSPRALAKLDVFIVIARPTRTSVTAAAHVVLAPATHVEDEGTFTQEAGITQRVSPRLPAQGRLAARTGSGRSRSRPKAWAPR